MYVYEAALRDYLLDCEQRMSEMAQVVELARADALSGLPPQQVDDIYLPSYLSAVKSLPRDIWGGVIYPETHPGYFSPDEEF